MPMRLWLALLVLLPLCACTPQMEVQVVRYPEADRADAEPSCPKVIEDGARIPSGCIDVGDVYVGDTGFSTRCHRERVLSEVHSAGCQVRANLAVARRITDPISSCYQVRARLLRCPPAEGVVE